MTGLVCLFFTLLSAPPPSNPAPVSEKDDVTSQARALFNQGTALYKSSKYELALAKFEETYALKPHPSVTYNIGRCHEKMGHVAPALRHYRQFLREAPNAPEAAAVALSMSNMETQLRARGVQQFEVTAQPANARIEIDGKSLGNSSASIELPAGSHQIVVSAPGFESVVKTVAISLARSSELSVELRKEELREATDAPKVAILTPQATEASLVKVEVPKKKPRVLTWVVAGLAAVAGGTGAVFGAMSSGNASKIRDATLRPDGSPNAQMLQGQMQTNATIANASFIGAGVAGVAAVVLFFVEGN
jgi:PEGA domain/Tetratricopeptide repeat